MEDTASTHIMPADEPKTYLNLNVADENPRDAMLAFMLMHIPRLYTSTPPLNQNLEQVIFGMLQVDSARTLQQVGRVTPPQSPRLTTEAPGAPIAPPRPTSVAVAPASGQPLATAVRALFAVVPAVVPDA